MQSPHFSKDVEGCRDGGAKKKAQKLHVGVGMAMCKKDRACKHCTSNPIPTSFFVHDILLRLCAEITGKQCCAWKKDVGIRIHVLVSCFYPVFPAYCHIHTPTYSF